MPQDLVTPWRFAWSFPLEGEPDRGASAFEDRMRELAAAELAKHGRQLAGEPVHMRVVYVEEVPIHLVVEQHGTTTDLGMGAAMRPCMCQDATHISLTWTWPPEMIV